MSARRFDDAARMLASGLPRRRVIGLLARVAAGGAAVVVTGLRASAKPACRGEGHPCEGNQTCCPGLICAESEHGSARRCMAGEQTQCEGDCPATEPGVVVAGSDIDIAAECAYSGERRRSTCTFTATPGNENIGSLTVPQDILCADVVGGDFEKIESTGNGQPAGIGMKSTHQEEGVAVVTVEFDGEVTTAATATYWCETDLGKLVPVIGPGLRCADSVEATATGVSNLTGAVVVHAYTCEATSPGADVAWFDACQTPTTQATFQLVLSDSENPGAVVTQTTNADGTCRFGDLPPGVYHLEQKLGEWCHAESDSVDDQGNILVTAAEVATVWIFVCVATE